MTTNDDNIPRVLARLLAPENGAENEYTDGFAQGWKTPIARIHFPQDAVAHLEATGEVILSIFERESLFEQTAGPDAGKRGGDRLMALALANGQSPRTYAAVRASRVTHLYLGQTLRESLSGDADASGSQVIKLADKIFVEDREIVGLARAYLKRALSADAPPSTLEMDARSVLIASQIIDRYGKEPLKLVAVRRQRMSKTQQAILVDYIDTNLESSIRIDDLAALVGVSPRHFSSLFRATFEISPHQFLILRRLERAKVLMESRLPLSMVALDCGFASQQHFTTTFHRIIGMPPAEWLRR